MEPTGLPVQLSPRAGLLVEGQATLLYRAHHGHHRVICANPLVLEPELGSFVYLEKFGEVVFWNCSDSVVASIHEELRVLPTLGARVEGVRDQLMVHVGGAEEQVGFSEVWLRDFTLDRLKIVSLALAQSVALDHIDGTVRGAMAKFEPVMAGPSRRPPPG